MNRRFRLIPIAIVALILLFKYIFAERAVNPETGRRAAVALSPEQESMLGLQGYQQVLQQSDVVSAGPEYDLVLRVAQRLIPTTGEAGRAFDWKVSVVRSPEVNAFCLPGGKIVVYTGILPVAKTEAALAAVMGHEMAHATSRHGAQRLFQDNISQTLMMGASMSFGDMDPQKRQVLMGVLGAGAKFGVLLPFNRKHETEADEIGLLYMARAGYDPRESIEFWRRMGEHSGRQPPEYLSTHPTHETRIRQLQEFMPKALAEYERAAGKAGSRP